MQNDIKRIKRGKGRDMTVEYQKGVRYSNAVVNRMEDILSADYPGSHVYIETFNNCREQGYYISCSSMFGGYIAYDHTPCAWVYANRNTDELTVILGDITYKEPPNNMFNEEAWRQAEQVSSVNTAADMILKHFKKTAEKHEKHGKFSD